MQSVVGGVKMVQADTTLLYLLYISVMVYIAFKYYEKAKKLKEMNEAFLMAIHDIKNYSVNIDASNQFLKRIVEDEGCSNTYNVLSKHLEVISSNCREMNGLIENYSKSIKLGEKHKDSISKENIIVLVEEAVKLSKYYARKKNIQVEIGTKYAAIYVELDKEKAIRIMCNLIMNGIKYSYEGGRILISVLSDDNWIEIRVIDRGKGMTYNQLKRVFDKHYSANDNLEIYELSLGVGLYASRRMAEEEGGHLIAESTEGEGSIFTLKLPLKRVRENKQKNFKGIPFN